MKSRVDLPTGTVTFLFSDIEGSTRLLQSLGDRYPEVLQSHQRLLRDAFAAHGGTVVGTEGDSFFVAFPGAQQALAAAVQGQRDVGDHAWPEGHAVRVRMGLHAGQGTLGGDDYVGIDVHRAARIAAAGHGGQVLISGSTRALVEHSMPKTVGLRDLGDHHLRDLEHPERLYQVLIGGAPADFPPVRSAERRLGNLPTALTTFIGRGRALQDVKELMAQSRLVTLTGPGGTGKTRLALQAAADLQPELEDGAFFVALASISNPELVVSTVADALGVKDDPGRPTIELLIEQLGARDILLVLDNFEQVLPAADRVGEMLEATDRVRALVTSREPLGLQGEHQYPVLPMEIPDMANLPTPERLSQYEGVALFIERASSVRPGFMATNENAPAIAEICARLDGLPLAIELAAATTKVLSPQAILSRLERRLPLLASGSRDLPTRQRTLRDAIAWSYELLDNRERTLFARLSVFVGGFTLEAAEAVGDRELGDTFEGVAALVNKSLLRQMDTNGAEPRFFMLQTIQEYAADRLAGVDAIEIERRHAGHFLAIAEHAEPELTGPRQAAFLDALAADHDNLRGALDRAAARGWVEVALKLGAALWRFWQMRGHLREGRERLRGVLTLPGAEQPTEARAQALGAAGSVAYWMGDFPAAQEMYEQALDVSRETGDQRTIAESLYNLAFALVLQDDVEQARGLWLQAGAIFHDLGDRAGQAKAWWAALSNSEEDDEALMPQALDVLEIFHEVGDRFMEGWAVRLVGTIAARLGRFDEARARLAEGLEIFRDAGDVSAIDVFLVSFIDLAVLEGDVERALRLAGAAAASRESTGTGLSEWLGQSEERQRLAERCDTDAEAALLWGEGQAMSLEDAVAYALGRRPGDSSSD